MTHVDRIPAAPAATVNRRIDAAAWGLFFVWIGIALLANVGWGAALLGVGIITVGAQAARKQFGLAVEGFWVGVGVLFLLGGASALFGVQVGFVPLLLIVAGGALLLSALRRMGD
jgi:hypothetical protein